MSAPTAEAVREAVGRTYFGPPESIDQGQARLAALVRETALSWDGIRWLSGLDDGLYAALSSILEAAGVGRTHTQEGA